MDLRLQDKVFVVTGGSRGLGLATATVLVEEGARVVLSSRDEDRLAEAAHALGGAGVETVVADLADPGAPGLLLDSAQAAFDRLDGALVSVGGPPHGGVLDTTDEAWRAGFESVFLGGVRTLRTVSEALVARGEGGAIAAVLSTSVKMPVPDLAISNGLRPGLGMVVKSLADEVGPHGVRVNGLLPGRIETERVQELDEASGDAAASRARHEDAIPLRRYGRPEEFGRMAAFLLSPAASFVNGAMVPVDGGMTRAL